MAMGIAAGAFGAHGLQGRVSAKALGWWSTAARYHLIHGLALLLIDRLAPVSPRVIRAAGWLMFAGLVLFSGSLYAMTLTGIRGLGAITPIGGLSWIVAWVLVAWAAWRYQP